MDSNIFKFEVKKLNGESISLKEFEGKTIVIINTASKCGLTPQYKGLEYLYKKYSDKGLVILGFPSNQFGQQEKGTAEEISEFCEINYGVSFPMFDKVEVNGTNTHPVFKYLKSKLRGVFGSNIKWNFTKFIIDKNGNPAKRFAPITKPEKMESYLQKIL